MRQSSFNITYKKWVFWGSHERVLNIDPKTNSISVPYNEQLMIKSGYVGPHLKTNAISLNVIQSSPRPPSPLIEIS